MGGYRRLLLTFMRRPGRRRCKFPSAYSTLILLNTTRMKRLSVVLQAVIVLKTLPTIVAVMQQHIIVRGPNVLIQHLLLSKRLAALMTKEAQSKVNNILMPIHSGCLCVFFPTDFAGKAPIAVLL